MVCHGIDILSGITSHLNGKQATVIFADQPLFAITKLIQWNWPEKYGENKVVAMLAPFHIEQVLARVIVQRNLC